MQIGEEICQQYKTRRMNYILALSKSSVQNEGNPANLESIMKRRKLFLDGDDGMVEEFRFNT